MDGPHALTPSNVVRLVESKIGVYELSRTRDGSIRYVGRAVDLAHRLGSHAAAGKYQFFRFEYTQSEKAAFEKESTLYHHYLADLDNAVHPARPEGKAWKCPRCKVFG